MRFSFHARLEVKNHLHVQTQRQLWFERKKDISTNNSLQGDNDKNEVAFHLPNSSQVQIRGERKAFFRFDRFSD